MQKILLTTLILTLWWSIAIAQSANVQLEWTGDATAVDYRIFESLDKGVTWTVKSTVIQPTPFPANSRVQGSVALPLTLPTDGLILYRVSARNAQGENIRIDAGAWKNPKWALPTTGGLGIQ